MYCQVQSLFLFLTWGSLICECAWTGYGAVQSALRIPKFHIPTFKQPRIESAGAKPTDTEGRLYSFYCTILYQGLEHLRI